MDISHHHVMKDLRRFLRGVDMQIASLNKSKIFAGVMIVILNIASKYVTVEVSPSIESYLKQTFSRQVLLFAIIWLGTRDIYVSLFGSVFVLLSIDFVLNENSEYCCLSESFKQQYDEAAAAGSEKKKKKTKTKKTKKTK